MQSCSLQYAIGSALWRPPWQDNDMCLCFRAFLLVAGQKHGTQSSTWHHTGVGYPVSHWHCVHTVQLSGKNIHLQGIVTYLNHVELRTSSFFLLGGWGVAFLSPSLCFLSTVVWLWFMIIAGGPVLEVRKWCFRQRVSKAHCNRIWWTTRPHHSCSVCAAVPEQKRISLLLQAG